ncbi:MAG: hypothetical protein RIR86_701 [Acidobacteriota bacterium]|jgi:CRISPR-associated protein Cas6
MNHLELRFPVTGSTLPIDHGYALYGAISRLIPLVHQMPALAIDSIKGRPIGPGILALSTPTTLNLRLPEESLPFLQALAERSLDIDGHLIQLAVPHVASLAPAHTLHSPRVTIKGHTNPTVFQDALRRQLDRLAVDAEPIIGHRRIIRISNHQIVGFEVRLENLAEDSSLILQEVGLGGRHKMGCGFFNPLPKPVWPCQS